MKGLKPTIPTKARAAPAHRVGPLRLTIIWAPAAVMMALIFYLSSKSSFGGPGWLTKLAGRFIENPSLLMHLEPLLTLGDRYASWLAHFSLYAVLAITFWWAIRRQWPALVRPGYLAFVLAVIYGVSDEIHQYFVPGRHLDWRDMLTNAAGAATALLLITLVVRRVEGAKR